MPCLFIIGRPGLRLSGTIVLGKLRAAFLHDRPRSGYAIARQDYMSRAAGWQDGRNLRRSVRDP